MARKYQLHGAFPSKAGDSAYEVALKNGFEGTEQEWLASLEGHNGTTPHIGDNNNWFIGGTDTGKPSKGRDGVSVTHEWDGTVLKVTSSSGTSSADLKGASGTATDEQVSVAVSKWLDEHPEATTTVADDSITTKKLADDVLKEIETDKNITVVLYDCMDANKTGFIQGKFVDGIPVEDANGSAYFTPYIKITDYKRLYHYVAGNPFLRFYDENKAYVGGGYKGDGLMAELAPQGAVYVVAEWANHTIFKYDKIVYTAKEKTHQLQHMAKGEAPHTEETTYVLPDDASAITLHPIYGETYTYYSGKTNPKCIIEEYDVLGKLTGYIQVSNGLPYTPSSDCVAYITAYGAHNVGGTLTGKFAFYDKVQNLNLILTADNFTPTTYRLILEHMGENQPTALSRQWANKSLMAFGTSITYISDKNGNVGYLQLLQSNFGFGEYVNGGQDGKAMADNTTNGTGIVSAIRATDVSAADLIIIEAGTNDFKLNVPIGELGMIGDTEFNTGTFYGAYRAAIEYIRSNNPTCPIIVCSPLQRDNSGYDVKYTNSAGHKLIDYVNAVEAVAEMYALEYVDLYRRSGMTKANLDVATKDGLHPNNIGYEMMYSCIAGKVKNMWPISKPATTE